MNRKLKPCPFCGGVAQILPAYSGASKVWYVICTNCHNTSLQNEIKQTVIEAWNRRVKNEG